MYPCLFIFVPLIKWTDRESEEKLNSFKEQWQHILLSLWGAWGYCLKIWKISRYRCTQETLSGTMAVIDRLLREYQDAEITFCYNIEVVLTFPELGEMKYLTCSRLSDRDGSLRDVTGLYLFCNCGALSWLGCESLIINRSTSSIYDLLDETRHVVTMDKMACFRYCNITALNNYHNDTFLSSFPWFNCTVCVCAFQLNNQLK